MRVRGSKHAEPASGHRQFRVEGEIALDPGKGIVQVPDHLGRQPRIVEAVEESVSHEVPAIDVGQRVDEDVGFGKGGRGDDRLGDAVRVLEVVSRRFGGAFGRC